MISNIFALIQLILKLSQLWEGFLDWMEERKIAIRSEKARVREAAIQAGMDADTEAAIWEAQQDVVKNMPRP